MNEVVDFLRGAAKSRHLHPWRRQTIPSFCTSTRHWIPVDSPAPYSQYHRRDRPNTHKPDHEYPSARRPQRIGRWRQTAKRRWAGIKIRKLLKSRRLISTGFVPRASNVRPLFVDFLKVAQIPPPPRQARWQRCHHDDSSSRHRNAGSGSFRAAAELKRGRPNTAGSLYAPR